MSSISDFTWHPTDLCGHCILCWIQRAALIFKLNPEWEMQHFRAWNFLTIHLHVLQRESWNYTDIIIQERNYEHWAFLCLPFSNFSSCIYKKKEQKKKIVINDHVLKTLSTLFSVFSFYRFDEKNRFSPTFGGLQFVNKILISFLRDKKRK